jgi:hypothetical protein
MIEKILIGLTALAVTVAGARFALADEYADQRIAEAFEQVVEEPQPPDNCLPRAEMRMAMAARYGETVQIFARSGPTIMEFFASRSRTWTAVQTGPEGISCMVSSGDAWTGPVPEPEPQSGPALYRIEPGSARPA